MKSIGGPWEGPHPPDAVFVGVPLVLDGMGRVIFDHRALKRRSVVRPAPDKVIDIIAAAAGNDPIVELKPNLHAVLMGVEWV